MKFICEENGEVYGSFEACREAEEKIKKVRAEEAAKKQKKEKVRAIRAKEVEAAQKEASKAIKNYKNLLNDFCKDYGSFHMTLDRESEDFSIKDLIGTFFF